MSGSRTLNIIRFGSLIFILLAPFLLNAYWLFLILQVVIFSYLALSFDIAYSYSRVLSFCQGLFFGLSAYVSVYVASPEPWGLLGMVVAGTMTAALAGGIVGIVLVRMHGHGAVIATVIIAACAFLIANAMNNVTGGEDGRGLASTTIGAGYWQVEAGLNHAVYFLAAVPLVGIFLALWAVQDTMTWTVARAVAQNPVRARLLGYNVELRTYVMYTFSAVVAGVGGSFYALAMRQVTTGALEISLSVNAILYAVVGGLGTDIGALIGGLLVLPATELIAIVFVHVQIVIGMLMTFVAVIVPKGIIGSLLARVANSPQSQRGSDHNSIQKSGAEKPEPIQC